MLLSPEMRLEPTIEGVTPINGGAVWAALAAFVIPGCLTPPSTAMECRRVNLDPRPRWTFSAEWLSDAEQLVIVDVLGGRILRYDAESASPLGAASHPGNGPKAFDRPLEITRINEQLVLLNRTDHVLGLDSDLSPAWGAKISDIIFPGEERVTHVRSLVGHEGSIVAKVRINQPDGERWWGIGRLVLGDQPSVERLEEFPPETTPVGYAYYAFPGPLLARSGSAVYALRFEGGPRIQRILPSPAPLSSFPAGYQTPNIPRSSGPGSTESHFQAWERSVTPEGLFGRGEFLYLLTRRPAAGGTEWMVHQIDPAEDRLVRTTTLPTMASHIVVVPGDKEWAIIEKGPVMGNPPEQFIGTAVFVPASFIEDPEAPAVVAPHDCVASDAP